jgi:WD40 repeat protein
MSVDHDKAEALFEAALRFKPEERAAFLAGACGNDEALRRQVTELLQANSEAGAFLPAEPRPFENPTSPAEALAGTIIGRYKLLQKIGEGGMGVVYMAEQEEPVRRRVALKIIKLGMDTQQVVARFEAERQALALMDHPNIAKVLDGGATDTGRPFFVMELVQGVPITEFCDKSRLSAEKRIKLFIQVCQAIQSAHQKGIIHRDLKPTNILVTLNAGVPVPMVIDFGVAKAIQQKLTEKTVFTNFATMIGTPAYMSPEQAEMSRLDVDTRSDIYGLGVLLYELLTGTTPFPEKRLRSAGYREMQRIIMEEEPERPSTRLRQKSVEASTLFPTTSHRSLSSDLDWIVMKCLEKDRERRYETANGLAADLNRHLENEPVVARPPSNLYRFQKMVRRNKLAFAAGATVMLTLMVGMALAAWQAVRATRAEREQTQLREQAQVAQREENRLREQAQAEAYASDMLLTQQAIEANNFGHARELLYRHRPQSKSDKDLRGWEWRYLWQQCTSDALAKMWQCRYEITSLAVSPDGKYLAIGQNSDQTAVTLLALTGRTKADLVANLPASRGMGVDTAFSPGGRYLAYGSSRYTASGVDITIDLWDIKRHQPVFEKTVRTWCLGLAFSPDGSRLLAVLVEHPGQADGGIMTLSVPDGTVLTDHREHISYPFPGICVDPGFNFVVVGGDTLQVLDIATGTQRWIATNQQQCFGPSVLSNDGRFLITEDQTNDCVLQVREISSGNVVGPAVDVSQQDFIEAPLLRGGTTLASGSADGTLQLWDVSRVSHIRPLGRPLCGPMSGPTALAVEPDGQTLISGSLDGSVYVWDATPPSANDSPTVMSNVFAWHFCGDSESVVTIDFQGNVARREGPAFSSIKPLLRTEPAIILDRDQAQFSDDGQLLARSRDITASPDNTVRVWDLRGKDSTPRHVIPGFLVANGFVARTHSVVVYDRAADSLEEWDGDTGRIMRAWRGTPPTRKNPIFAGLSGDERYLIYASADGDRALTKNVRTGETISLTNLDMGRLLDMKFSPSGKLVALADITGTVRIWDSGLRRPVITIGDHQFPAFGVNFSPDESRLLTVSGTKCLSLWDFRTGRELLKIPPPTGESMPGSIPGWSPVCSADNILIGCLNLQSQKSALYLWRAPSWAEIETTEKTVPDSPSTNMQKGNL